jgi:predicted 2-oxoglutarate/Fe(II)-dependent dioxygenase YbiX
MIEGRKNIGEQGSKIKKTSMTKGRKNIGEQGSKVKKTSRIEGRKAKRSTVYSIVVQLDASDIQVSPNQIFLSWEFSKSGFGTWEFGRSGFEGLAV